MYRSLRRDKWIQGYLIACRALFFSLAFLLRIDQMLCFCNRSNRLALAVNRTLEGPFVPLALFL